MGHTRAPLSLLFRNPFPFTPGCSSVPRIVGKPKELGRMLLAYTILVATRAIGETL